MTRAARGNEARAWYVVGDRVRTTDAALASGATDRRRAGVVCGRSLNPDLVRIRWDGRKEPQNFHHHFVERDITAPLPPADGDTGDRK